MNIIYSGMFFSVTEDEFYDYEKTFPGVGIAQELRRMDSWCRANPRRRKKNWKRFIENWLGKTRRDLLAVELRSNVRSYKAAQEARVGSFEHVPVRVKESLRRMA